MTASTRVGGTVATLTGIDKWYGDNQVLRGAAQALWRNRETRLLRISGPLCLSRAMQIDR